MLKRINGKMPPRKKRGSKANVSRKVKPPSSKTNNLPTCTTDTNMEDAIQSNDSSNATDNLSITKSRVEPKKTTMVTRAHKKFGKFRFLLEVSSTIFSF